MRPFLGGCLCESTRYKISQPPISQGICYCRQCRKAGGACGSPVMVLSKATFECSPGTLSTCETTSSRNSVVTRNFCKNCGSHIFAQISDVPDLVTVRAATLDDFSLFTPQYLVWTQSAGPSCVFPKGIPAFPENAPLAVILGRTIKSI
ncbi:MAG: GFA family protein [Deltaproteobacteria bacterium]|nr:GFA family protein [Deltaproteobacteria bacterium]